MCYERKKMSVSAYRLLGFLYYIIQCPYLAKERHQVMSGKCQVNLLKTFIHVIFIDIYELLKFNKTKPKPAHLGLTFIWASVLSKLAQYGGCNETVPMVRLLARRSFLKPGMTLSGHGITRSTTCRRQLHMNNCLSSVHQLAHSSHAGKVNTQNNLELACI